MREPALASPPPGGRLRGRSHFKSGPPAPGIGPASHASDGRTSVSGVRTRCQAVRWGFGCEQNRTVPLHQQLPRCLVCVHEAPPRTDSVPGVSRESGGSDRQGHVQGHAVSQHPGGSVSRPLLPTQGVANFSPRARGTPPWSVGFPGSTTMPAHACPFCGRSHPTVAAWFHGGLRSLEYPPPNPSQKFAGPRSNLHADTAAFEELEILP